MVSKCKPHWIKYKGSQFFAFFVQRPNLANQVQFDASMFLFPSQYLDLEASHCNMLAVAGRPRVARDPYGTSSGEIIF